MTRFPCDSASRIQGAGPDIVAIRDISWVYRDICWETMIFDGDDGRISAVRGSTCGEESRGLCSLHASPVTPHTSGWRVRPKGRDGRRPTGRKGPWPSG